MAAERASGKIFVARGRPDQAVATLEALHAQGLQAETASSVRAVIDDATETGPACFVADPDSLSETPEPSAERLAVMSLSEARRRANAIAEGSVHFVDPKREIGSLAESVKIALAQDAGQFPAAKRRQDVDRRIGRLSLRDRQVMRLIYDEYPNKAIAAELDISQRTVEGIRAKIFRVLGVATGIGLARLLAESRYFLSSNGEQPS